VGKIPGDRKMTWEIALGIFALISFIGMVVGWTNKIYGTLSKLNASVDNLNETVKEFKENQNTLIEHVNDHDITLIKHEEQIKNLQTTVNSDK